MADRQTDKATWWSITTFDEGEQGWLKAGVYPGFVKQVHGGLEKCPTSNRIHFQGALQCKAQQRFSAIKAILPKAHIEAAISSEALRKYAMKDETAVEAKKVHTNATPYFTQEMLLRLLAIQPTIYRTHDTEKDYWYRANIILLRRPFLVGMLTKPDTYRAWKHTSHTWEVLTTNAETNERQSEESIVLQTPPEEEQVPTIRLE